MTPKISVIIPCFNLGQYLDDAVESVLAQTCQDFEIIVVDDGLTEPATTTVLAGYRRPKTRVIRTEHRGVSAARNLGIGEATGAYLCALDADDRLEPTYFEKAVRILDVDTSIGFVSAWLRMFGEDTWEWRPQRCDLRSELCEDGVLTAAIVRREIVVAAGGYDTEMPLQGLEDWDLWITLMERGHRGTIIPEILFNYRKWAGSLSSVSWWGSGHLPLAKYRLAKHQHAYRAHLEDVLLHLDGITTALLRQNDQFERDIMSELEPAVAERHKELARLRDRLGALPSP